MTQINPYQAYMQGTVLSSDPVKQVTALYEKAIESIQQAKFCLDTGDAFGRSTCVTKAIEIMIELMISLDFEKGGEVSENLKRLYSYMQQRLLEAHIKKSEGMMTEVEKLLKTLLEAWYVVAEKNAQETKTWAGEYSAAGELEREEDLVSVSYGGY